MSKQVKQSLKGWIAAGLAGIIFVGAGIVGSGLLITMIEVSNKGHNWMALGLMATVAGICWLGYVLMDKVMNWAVR